MSKNRQKDLFSSDVPLHDELKEAGFDKKGGGSQPTWFSNLVGNQGRFCTITKECQRICRWW